MILILVALAVAWIIGNLAGYVFAVHAAKFNWRIFLGPGAYLNWLEDADPAAYEVALWGRR